MSLRHAMLGLLNYTPMSGYSLKKTFDSSIGHIWSAELSQIYRELGALEKEGLITARRQKQTQRPDKIVYAIAEEGITCFTEWLNRYPVVFGPPHRDEFLLRVFFASAMEKPLLARELRGMIEAIEAYESRINERELPVFRDRLIERGENPDRKGLQKRLNREARYWRFTVRRFQLVGEATKRWARECIRELEEEK